MTKQLIKGELINNSYLIHILKNEEVIFEVCNWNNLSSTHKRECEEFVDYLSSITKENERFKNYIEAVDKINQHLKKENKKLKQQIKSICEIIEVTEKRFIAIDDGRRDNIILDTQTNKEYSTTYDFKELIELLNFLNRGD